MTEPTMQVDEHRWLLNNGLVTDFMKNNLIMYGYLVSKEVQDVELDIDVEKKHLKYKIGVHRRFISVLDRFRALSGSNSIWDLWRVKRILKKHGNLNIIGILSNFIKQLCGPAWTVELHIADIADNNAIDKVMS